MAAPKYAPSRPNTAAFKDEIPLRPVTALPAIPAPPPVAYKAPKKSTNPLTKSAAWLIFASLGIFVGVLSSMDVISDYHGGATIQSITYHRNESLEFPAVTVCDNIISSMRNREESLEPSLFMEYEEERLSSKEKIALASIKEDKNETKDFFQFCSFKGRKCTENQSDSRYFYSFYNHYLGSCSTFNPGFKTKLMGRSGDVLTLVIASNSHNRPVALIHSSGSAPVFDFPRLIQLFPETSVSIATHLMKLENQILCDPTLDEVRAAKGLYQYSTNTPYLYTHEACMATCRQRTLTGECLKSNHSCLVDPTVALPRSLPKEKITGIWNPERKISVAFEGDSVNTEHNCLCPPSCKETVFSSTVSALPFPENQMNKNLSENGHIEIRVFSESFLYEAVVEDVKYTGSEYWGLVGGNILFSTSISLLLCTTILLILGKITLKNLCPQK